MNDQNYILRDNLDSALTLAIAYLEQREAKNGPSFVSGLRAGFIQVLEESRKGNPIIIRE